MIWTGESSIVEIGISAGMLVGGMILGSGFWCFVLCCVIIGISIPFYNGPLTALMQERIDPEYLGRVFGLYSSVASLAMPVGLVFSGAFADRVGIQRWFFLSGLLIVLTGLLMAAIPSIRKIDRKDGEETTQPR